MMEQRDEDAYLVLIGDLLKGSYEFTAGEKEFLLETIRRRVNQGGKSEKRGI